MLSKKWCWQFIADAWLDAAPQTNEIPDVWCGFSNPEDAHASAQRSGWRFGEYVVFAEGGEPIPTIESLLAEVERLRSLLDEATAVIGVAADCARSKATSENLKTLAADLEKRGGITP